MWLPSVLLLLCLPGSLSLIGPGSVAGTAGSSLRIRCQYEKVYKGHNKYWCRGKYGIACRKIVETKGEEKEKRNGRVSIRDHTDNLTFTVTLENLNINDTGSYWCRIQTVWILDVLSLDPSVQVEVSVSPAPRTNPGSIACPAVPATFPTVSDGQNLSIKEMSSHCPGSWLSNVHFLLLVFLKLPLFLGMVGAVLWVNRPQRRPGGRERQLDQRAQLIDPWAAPDCSATAQHTAGPKQGHLHEGQEHHADVAEEDAYEAQCQDPPIPAVYPPAPRSMPALVSASICPERALPPRVIVTLDGHQTTFGAAHRHHGCRSSLENRNPTCISSFLQPWVGLGAAPGFGTFLGA
ncbi:unnamed protein product [Rangifer tarandus platyrhynchus]|uniref:Ig-like domain-containing protein n=1 Tax=Rangifer tarandus platyrhynchus TaxID=3082113 RepID=A0ABN8YQS3_RANTA|nr:unnamed protein product [Rangifer tarandus platyrhynchus]